ncbi:MAG: DnaJ domain-containing protein [Thermoanaerobaculum sp.]|nr:DnaJ domain-containing protein [Thermoanaerobaculum sp.]MDW7966946.1 DnaJ domain-containing protein [Thermoanaerobaculum sp.]
MGREANFYELLGVQRSASTEEIRAAFRRLARELHPDRFQGAEKARAEERFQRITQAFNILSNPDTRARYDRSLELTTPSGPIDPKDLAKALLAKAIMLVKQGNPAEAHEFFQQAEAHDPNNARVQHQFGLFLAQIGRLEQGLRKLEKACNLEPLNGTYHLDCARLFMKAGMYLRAMRFAEQAAKLLPDDPMVNGVLAELKVVLGKRS